MNELKEAIEKTSYVFVYGSLKRGYWNNQILDGATFVDTATSSSPVYALYDGAYPVVSFSSDGDFLGGEVYEVDVNSLQRCDWLEGHPSFYERVIVPIDLDNSGEKVFAWVYIGRNVLNHWDLSDDNRIKPDTSGTVVWGDPEEQAVA